MDLRKWSQLSRDQDLRRDRGQSSQPLRDQDVGNRGHSFRPTGNDPDVEHRRPARNQDVEEVEEESFNILPLHDMLADHDALRFPEVRAARAALQVVGELARPEGWRQSMDMLDWLALLFGFQAGNVKNQREHIVMLLANKQMQLQPPPDPIDCMDAKIVHKLRKKVLKNYSSWCSYLGKANNLWLGRNNEMQEQQRELLYTSLYLLIWGEAANLRFMPESLCFIFHNMAGEMNKVLEHGSNDVAQQSRSVYSGENAFLLRVITPLYKIVKAEAEASHEGKAPHSSWRNYDDMNEFFWSKRCLTQLSWPLNLSCSFMAEPSTQQRKVGKTGFVEQRSFWNIFRSFDHLWTGYILLLQAMIIMAFHSGKPPWTQLVERDVQARILSIFITWAGLRILQCLLDVLMQFRLISVDTMLIGLRMLLKIAAASVWTLVFVLLYTNMWKERHTVGGWSAGANTAFILFLEVALVFILPEILALTLFILPWIRNFVEKSDLRIFHVLTWWFQSRWFVGRGLREGIWDNIKYTLFWLIVFLVKFSFSYFLQIRPLVEPTKQLLALNNINYSWHEFWGKGSNRIAVSVLWAPVLLIYFMDMQIWYTVFSSFAGALVGLFGHLGEIRNMEQMKLRFPFFASAVAFNLMPGESLLETKAWGSWLATVSNAWHRLKLRYGLGAHYKRHATDSLEAGRFAFMWNSIISILREEDLLSDRELQLLEIPAPAWNISVIQWPSLLLSNELRLALGQVKQWNGTDDKWLWRKICKIEHRRCAVIECYDSIRHVLRRIIREGSEEHGRVERLLLGIQYSLESGTFLQDYVVKELPEVHERVLALVTVLAKKPNLKDLPAVVRALQNLYEVVVLDLRAEKQPLESQNVCGLAGVSELLFADVVELPDPGDASFFRQLRRFITILSTKESMLDVPKNLEAQRRIAFFSNSLFMNMPRAPTVEKMLAFSVLTPYYSEDVMYSKEKLQVRNEDGISIIYYLQKIFPDEWDNFKERMRRDKGVKEEKELWNPDNALQLRLWASYRGQTLARTVRGMMYYQQALKLLAYLDGASQIEMQEGRELLAAASVRGERTNASAHVAPTSSHPWVLNRIGSGVGGLFKEAQQDAVANMKFTYVVTCQIYGAQKAKKHVQADDILFLMKTYNALRIAYVDEVEVITGGSNSKQYFSVLVKYDSLLEKEVEIYRIQLPGPLKLGEGKPENQNHAIIFTRGDAVQTIDMNQDNYFEETLKARNLLQEFTVHHGLRRPQILGVREHVFTGSVSSLASFMSAQETSFVTLGQRVLANPLKVRMHYGHPDVFDRLWFVTRGGISKASKVINISEDIFAGFNCTLRGGNVTHHEYIQAGKGRDVGLNQIALFEAKVASGNGEQILSRDVYRLGHRLDFFRMLSFYYTTVGFFISNMMVVLTVYAFLWGRVYIALSGLDKSIEGDGIFANRALTASLNQQFIVQLGIFTALPMIVENSIERGFASAIWDFVTMQLQLSSVFFTFSLGTRAHFFGRTVLHGGAKYRATGRGFVVVHEKFAHIYRLFSRSHFVKGVELIVLLVIYESFAAIGSNTTAYILITFSSWFLALSWITGPFLFNPSGFDWLKTVEDFDDFLEWIWHRKGIATKSEMSWEIWWDEEQDHLRSTGFWGKVIEVVLNLRFLFLQYGVVYQLDIAGNSKSILVYLLSWVYMAVVGVIYIILVLAAARLSVRKHIYYRLVQASVAIFVVAVVIMLVQLTSFHIVDALLSLLAFVPTGWGLLSIALVYKNLLQRTPLWPFIVSMARLYELGIGIMVFIPVAVLSWLPGFQNMQTRILFNQAFSRGLQISRILVGKRPNSGF